ncbi:MAG: hypothetical protein DWQ02_09000 [Bacteroidetes bacterium]|nr:MAG: hypothetical protein DWQ02_09000 [Bacteroidota bacterium]
MDLFKKLKIKELSNFFGNYSKIIELGKVFSMEIIVVSSALPYIIVLSKKYLRLFRGEVFL